MKFLGLDTSKSKTYIVLINDKKETIKVLQETRKVSENLLVEIDNLLKDEKLALNEIDYFGAITGPGSFTGIRIGMATIKAFACALNKRIIGLNAFEPYLEEIENGVMILSSTKTTCYYAEIKNNEILNMGVVDIGEILEKFINDKLYTLDECLLENFDAILLKDYENKLVRAFKNKISNGEFVTLNEFAPLYLQLSQAELNLKENKHD